MVKFSFSLFILSIIAQLNATNILDSSDCNTKYGCFLNPKGCSGKSCEYIAKWKESSDDIEFSIGTQFGKLKSMWLAIGFSYDKTMGNDSVVVCKYNSENDVKIENYFNVDQIDPELVNEKNPSEGLTDIKVVNDQSFLICSFKRVKKNFQMKRFFDLSEHYYFLMAKGQLDKESGISYHGKNKLVSHNMIDFSTAIEVKSVPVSTSLIKVHAILMIVAWSFMSTIGILFARYYKFIFPSIKIGGVQFWFTIHRSFMSTVCILSLIGFGFIFAYKNWKWIEVSSKINFAHSITGILAIGLSLIQPIMAFFRPDKSAPNRPIFNWAHRTVGLTSYFCSIAALFLGVIIFVESFHWIALLTWIVWLLVLAIALEIIDYRITSNYKVQNTENGQLEIEKEKKDSNSPKTYFLILHIVLSIGWNVALILAILEYF